MGRSINQIRADARAIDTERRQQQFGGTPSYGQTAGHGNVHQQAALEQAVTEAQIEQASKDADVEEKGMVSDADVAAKQQYIEGSLSAVKTITGGIKADRDAARDEALLGISDKGSKGVGGAKGVLPETPTSPKPVGIPEDESLWQYIEKPTEGKPWGPLEDRPVAPPPPPVAQPPVQQAGVASPPPAPGPQPLYHSGPRTVSGSQVARLKALQASDKAAYNQALSSMPSQARADYYRQIGQYKG